VQLQKVFSEAGGSRPLGVLSLAALSLGMMAPAAKMQTVIILPRAVTGAIGHMTPADPLVDGLIHLV
jgi:hypothetical protein